jgi:phosphoribosyl 1,2-cyclic phosphodiesterase
VGFRIVCPNGDTIGIATDVGCVTSQVAKGLTGCNVVILESNHDPDMLWTGPYPSHLKKRVASDVGHLSNQACGELLSTLIKTGTTDVALFHLSKENNTERIAMETVRCAIIGCGEDPDKVCIKIAKEKETVQVV